MHQSFIYSLLSLLVGSSMIYVCEAQNCGPLQVRQDIHDLTDTQRNAYFRAITTLQSGSRPTRYDKLSQMHYDARNTAHGWSWFFPWHRAYLLEFQRQLRTVDSSIVIPYWDWSVNSQAPEQASVWRSDWYGGNGRSEDKCVVNGQFRNYKPMYPQSHCLQRSWDSDTRISAFYSPQALSSLIATSTTFDQFRQRLESVPHGQVHVAIGMDMSTMYSSNDPLFFLHHGFIDKLWADWQASAPGRDTAYGGRNAGGSAATVNDILTPFNIPVRNVLKTRDLCYVYAPRRTASRSMIQSNANNAQHYNNRATSDAVAKNTTVVAVPSTASVLPAPDDRTELVALRSTKPVPESWLRANNHDVGQARATESDLLQTTKKFNENSNEISSAALINQEDVLKSLASSAKQFTITNARKRVNINLKNSESLVDAIKKAASSVMRVLSNAHISNPFQVAY
ncbi:hypothetical protein BDF19DRAFT_431159 [Syncephalis fuscata]|nr:hypothetical protein BDF19DRAFT_431159 [Syncephalis fuscata]